MQRKKPPRKEKTIVVEERSTAQLPQAVGPAPSGPKHLSWARLDYLYAVTTLLVNFESAEKTLPEILAVMSNTLPLRSVVLIDEMAGHATVHAWKAEGVSEDALQAAREHGITAYTYLAGSGSSTKKNAAGLPVEEKATADENFIVVPLVAKRLVNGILQVECMTAFNPADVAFVNTIANQFAVALDRDKARQQEMAARVEAEAAEQRMTLLAESRQLLSSSIDYHATWESLADLLISRIGDLCLIDIVENERWPADRVCVLSPAIAGQMTEQAAANAAADVMSTVLNTGEFAVYPVRSAASKLSAATAYGASMRSYVCVPLVFEAMTIGTLTVATRSAMIYKDSDLSMLQDIGLSVVVAFNRARLYRAAIEAIRSRDDLISILAHDLRAPLTVIVGYMELFLQSSPTGERLSCDSKSIEAVQRSALQIQRLIEDLLSTASIEAKHFVIERQWNEIEPLLDEALKRMEPLASARSIELKSAPPDYVPPILVDHERIMQVFANLIGNAIKFSPAGSTVTIRAERSGNDVQFSVEDNGPGIPAEQLAHIFDRFWQGPGNERKGTGLGLFIVKGIVEAHGGRVWAERNPVAVSTFRFTIPVGPSK